jgi:hypothetical protein
MRRPVATAALCVGLLAAATACGAGKHRVAVEPLNADLAFGATTTTTSTTLASDSRERLGVPALSADQLSNAFFAPLKPRLGQTDVAAVPCPDASASAVAADAATDNVPRGVRPSAGVYRWKRAGTQKFTAFPITAQVGGFERRLIRNVTAVDDTTYTYEVVQPEVIGNTFVITTYRVKTAATQTDTINVDSVHERAGEPERGVSIIGIERRDSAGDLLAPPFAPVPGVLILPLPVLDGEQYQGTGIDPITGDSLQIQGQLVRKVNIDACGQVLDGWLVSGTKVFAGSAAHTESYDIVFATQFGAVPIRDHIVTQTADASFDLTYTVGQKSPTPS